LDVLVDEFQSDDEDEVEHSSTSLVTISDVVTESGGKVPLESDDGDSESDHWEDDSSDDDDHALVRTTSGRLPVNGVGASSPDMGPFEPVVDNITDYFHQEQHGTVVVADRNMLSLEEIVPLVEDDKNSFVLNVTIATSPFELTDNAGTGVDGAVLLLNTDEPDTSSVSETTGSGARVLPVSG
jgi:hypothetical protein